MVKERAQTAEIIMRSDSESTLQAAGDIGEATGPPSEESPTLFEGYGSARQIDIYSAMGQKKKIPKIDLKLIT